MRYLTIIRHAKTEKQSATGTDFDRRLTDRGVDDINTVADELKERGIVPDTILTSDATRARQTAELILNSLALPEDCLVADSGLYHADGHDVVEAIKTLPETVTRAFVVGHNPAMTDALDLLCPDDFDDMKPGDAAHIAFPDGSWSGTAPRTGALEAYIVPARKRKSGNE